MMQREAIKEKLLCYLKTTEIIRDQKEQTKLLHHIEGYNNENDVFVVTPWDLEQIALNIEVEDSHAIESILSELREFVELVTDDEGINRLKRVEPEIELGTIIERNEGEVAAGMTIEDSFKWYLYHKIRALSENGKRPVGISEGIFSIKNELMLPDDFIPVVMMEMVEGSKLVDIRKARSEIQPSGIDSLIYIFGKHSGGKFLEPHSFYYNSSPGATIPDGLDKLGEKIGNSFAEFQETLIYENFLFSRIMRNVIFSVEVKKKRGLGKPLFDPLKLAILERRGIVVMDGEKGNVREDYSIEDLKKVMKIAEDEAANASAVWMKSSVRL